MMRILRHAKEPFYVLGICRIVDAYLVVFQSEKKRGVCVNTAGTFLV